MNWEIYKQNLIKIYSNLGFDNDYIATNLSYAENLYKNKVPIIYDSYHLCNLLGYSTQFLHGITNKPKSFYRIYNIPKKSGGYRSIAEPLPNLKEIQSWINYNILKKIEDKNKYIKSYKSNTSIKDNARFHKNQKNVFSLDISNYFPSISEKKVITFFRNLGYNQELSIVLAKLCCLNKCLPQGAPTSPLLSNLITLNIDKRIFGFCKSKNIRYTRYADDLTFSGDFNHLEILKFTKKVLSENGFELNNKKIRNKKQYQQQRVTGIIVNKKLQVPAEVRKSIRQEIYYINKFGIEDHLKKNNITEQNYLDKLLGKINFALFINPKDEKMISYKQILKTIKEKN